MRILSRAGQSVIMSCAWVSCVVCERPVKNAECVRDGVTLSEASYRAREIRPRPKIEYIKRPVAGPAGREPGFQSVTGGPSSVSLVHLMNMASLQFAVGMNAKQMSESMIDGGIDSHGVQCRVEVYSDKLRIVGAGANNLFYDEDDEWATIYFDPDGARKEWPFAK